MKVLIVQVGTPVNPDDYKDQQLFQEPTITQGMQYFRYGEVVNNMQTRESITEQGILVDHIYFTGRKNPLNCIKAAIKIRQLVKGKEYELVNQYWGGMSSFFTAFLCPCVYIISLLGSDLYGQYKQNGSRTLMGRMLSFFSQLTIVFASGVIVMSGKMKERLWVSSRKKAIAICEGISLAKFFPIPVADARKHLAWEMEKPVILFFSSDAYVKNMPLAKKAFEALKEELPSAQLFMVQGIPHAELVWYYNAANLLLMTSYHEGSNNSIKEALACNLPVVSVNVGDAAERLHNVTPSAVVDSFEPRDLAHEMLKVLRKNMRSNGLDKVNEVELPNIAVKIVGYYSSFLKN
ncbi:MAG: glycosyltransferase family 4 protein [Chitinophagaceae bacterium]